MNDVFLAIDSNIEAEANLRRAAAMLRERWPGIVFSSVYRTAPRELTDQPEFLNAVAKLETDQSPVEVLATLQGIEQALGKNVPVRFGPRTIDLDLLLHGDTVMEGENLTLPHPRMCERRFVLEPLCDLTDPHAKHPAFRKTWESLLEGTLDQDCELTAILL